MTILRALLSSVAALGALFPFTVAFVMYWVRAGGGKPGAISLRLIYALTVQSPLYWALATALAASVIWLFRRQSKAQT
jgi:hypothetical protein